MQSSADKYMNLVVITRNFPAEGGDTAFFETEWKYLCQNFANVYLISKSKDHSKVIVIPENVNIYWYNPTQKDRYMQLFSILNKDFLKELLKSFHGQKITKWLSRFRDILATELDRRAFSKYLKKIKMDLNDETMMYSYWMTGETLTFLDLKKKNKNVKVISRVHGYDLYNERTLGGWQPYRNRLSQELDAIYFASKQGKIYFDEKWPNCMQQTREVAKLGCKPAEDIIQVEKSYKKNKINLLSCSNVIKLKRIDLIIEALALLPEDVKVQWYHIGDGCEMNKIEIMAHQYLDDKNNIDWAMTGRMEHSQIDRFYFEKEIQLFIIVSETEGGCPVSIQEAFAHKVPAIGTAVGGIPELIINKKTGLLLNENPSARSIANAILEYIKYSNAECRSMSENAFKLYQREYNADINAQRFVENLLLY